MGTTLTGTTPQDTYDSLIKVTDNGPLSATAKYLSDGLGNDSVLALSNARVGVATTSPLTTLQVGSTSINNAAIGSSLVRLLSRSTANDVQEIGLGGEGSATMSAIGNLVTDGASFAKGAIYFATRDVTTNTAPTERMRITSAGNVGIGTNAPTSGGVSSGLRIKQASDGAFGFTGIGIETAAATSELLYLGNTGTRAVIGQTYLSAGAYQPIAFDVSGSERFRVTAYGVTFNGDTAVANALDDYEEGTWTIGVSFGGASVGVTTDRNTGTYTKIGRQVTVNGNILLSSKGSSTGVARITGLPFTIPNSNSNLSPANLLLVNITFANQFVSYGTIDATTIDLGEVTEAGVFSTLTNADFANNSEAIISLTYFV